jgi:hypothetical protein
VGSRTPWVLLLLAASACRSEPAEPVVAPGSVASGSESDALAIRDAARAYLTTHHDELAATLAPDFAPYLPEGAGDPRFDPLMKVFVLDPWQLRLDGDQAELRYVPPGALRANWRAWMSLGFERKSGRWQVIPGIGKGIAHTRPPPESR